jgi:hypothetical protein
MGVELQNCLEGIVFMNRRTLCDKIFGGNRAAGAVALGVDCLK